MDNTFSFEKSGKPNYYDITEEDGQPIYSLDDPLEHWEEFLLRLKHLLWVIESWEYQKGGGTSDRVDKSIEELRVEIVLILRGASPNP